jgi:hypothetical protein
MSEVPLYDAGAGRGRRDQGRHALGQGTKEKKSSLSIAYWSESTLSSKRFGGPASRHGSSNPLLQVAFYLPFLNIQGDTLCVKAQNIKRQNILTANPKP